MNSGPTLAMWTPAQRCTRIDIRALRERAERLEARVKQLERDNVELRQALENLLERRGDAL